MQLNFVIYETTIKPSIDYTLDEIKEVTNKPKLKHIKYRGQHKNASININDISYTGSGTSLTLILDYFRSRDSRHYTENDIFEIQILETGYKTEREINMAEAKAISEMVSEEEVVKDVTLNGNNGITSNNSNVNNNNMVPAPYGTHADGSIVGDGKPNFEPSVQFSARHFNSRPADDRFSGYDGNWWRTKLAEAQQNNAQVKAGGDFLIMLVEHYENTQNAKSTSSSSSNVISKAIATSHLTLIQELINE